MADTREILLKLIGRESVSTAAKKAGAGLKDMGDAADNAARDTRGLDRELERATNTVEELRREIARTGDVKLFKDLGRAERDVKKLSGLKAAFANLGGEVAPGFAAQFIGRVGPLMARAPVSGPLVGAIIGASPAIAAAVSGAVLAGLSAGVVAAGVKTAFNSPQVKAEGESFARFMDATLADSFRSFEPATIAGMRVVRGEVSKLRPLLRDIGDEGAKFVAPLTRGVTSLVRNAIPGIKDGLAESGPVIYNLERGLGQVGAAAGDAVSSIAEGAAGAGLAIGDMLATGAVGVRLLGHSVGNLSKVYQYMRVATAGDRTAVVSEIVAGEAASAGWEAELRDLIERLKGTGDAGADAAVDIGKLHQALNDMVSASVAGQQATIGIEEAIDNLKGQIREYGTSLDETTAKGRANQEFILGWIADINAKADATEQAALADGQSAEAAAAAGAQIRQKLVSSLVAAAEKAGMNKRQINAMVAAIRKADGERIRIYYDKIYRTFGKPHSTEAGLGIGGSQFVGRAIGGPVAKGQPYMVGEKGPELMVPNTDGTVLTADQTRRALAGTPGTPVPAAGGVVRHEHVVTLQWPDGTTAERIVLGALSGYGSNSVVEKIAQKMRYHVRTTTAGDVQAAFGR